MQVRQAYADQQRRSAQATTLVAGAVALVAFPAWAIFDIAVLPAQADLFIGVRAGFELAIIVGWLALRWVATYRWPLARADRVCPGGAAGDGDRLDDPAHR